MKNIFFLNAALVLCANYHVIFASTAFHIGNSHTWDLKPHAGLRKVFEAGGVELNNDWQIVCGRSLDYIVNNPSDSCVSPEGYADYVDALTDKSWDIITIQPFTGASGYEEIEAATDLIDLASWRSSPGKTRYLIHCSWPIVPDSELLHYDYQHAWTLPFTSSEDPTLANREFFIYAIEAIRDEFPNLSIEAIPVGAVMEAFHLRAVNGDIPGFTGAGGLYRDRYHMNNVGHFIAALTAYCVITGNLASDLGSVAIPGFAENTEVDHEITEELRLEIFKLVDSVIAEKPFDPPMPKLSVSQGEDASMGVSFKSYTGFIYTLKFSRDLVLWDNVFERVKGDSSRLSHIPDTVGTSGFWKLISE